MDFIHRCRDLVRLRGSRVAVLGRDAIHYVDAPCTSDLYRICEHWSAAASFLLTRDETELRLLAGLTVAGVELVTEPGELLCWPVVPDREGE